MNTPSTSTSGYPSIIPNSSESNTIVSDYISDIQDIFKTLNDFKENFQETKFIHCIKNISTKTKQFQYPMQKMLVIIIEFDKFAN